MANPVLHIASGIELDPGSKDVDPALWDLLYAQDRQYAADRVPVSARGLQCAGVCREQGVIAWMHLRQRANGRREAVHEHREDEARHQGPARSPEHIAYQERIVQAAERAGFPAGTEVRTATGPRSWIQTDTVVEGEDGLRIGWEVQLSTAPTDGPRSVRSRAGKASGHGITPAWHTDRADYAQRNDTQWTRSNRLPAHVIARTGDLRVIAGFRVLDFWRCDARALYQCPNGKQSGCGETHVTPKPRDILFDDLVRRTAAGLIVPVEHRIGSRTHRFWAPTDDRNRYLDAFGGAIEASDRDEKARPHASQAGPTCQPRPRIEIHRPAISLNWRDRSHVAPALGTCRICGMRTMLLDDAGRPACKVCVEGEQGGGAL